MGISPEILGKGMNLEDGQVIYNDLRDRIEETNQEVEAVENQVIISDTQPSATSNKLCIDDSSGTEVTVPTYAEFEALSDSAVTDVQVNGTSIVSNGIANVPMATASSPGVITAGNGLEFNAQNGKLQTNNAGASTIKSGLSTDALIVPGRQHLATFYGLAKAAGADMASLSSTTVGQYPDAQKIAIQKMLGIPNTTGELIYETTLTADASEIAIDVDSNGLPFKLTKVICMVDAPAISGTSAREKFYGQFRFMRPNGTDATISFPSVQYINATSVLLSKITIIAHKNMPVEVSTMNSSSEGNIQPISSMAKPFIAEYITRIRIYKPTSTDVDIPSGTNVKLYGIRLYE